MNLLYSRALEGVVGDEERALLGEMVAHVKNWGDFRVSPYLRASVIVNLVDEIKRLKETYEGVTGDVEVDHE